MRFGKIISTIFKVMLIVLGFAAIIFGSVYSDPYYTIIGVLYLIWFDVTVIGERGIHMSVAQSDKGYKVTVTSEKRP